MAIKFTKMHGLGNDFVVIDTLHQRLELSRQQMRAIADRHFGVGCDQILLVEPATNPQALFRYRIFNADGGEVEQCGNGARCFARFVHDKGLTQEREIPVETAAGLIRLYLEDDGQVRVDMGVPRFTPQEIPLLAPARTNQYKLEIAGRTYRLGAVSLGNPHAVLQVEDVARAPVHELGAQIESHPDFPQRVNVGFMEVVNPAHIRLRVFERGVGETLACGTGACAAVVIGRVQGLLESTVTVSLPGGDLIIHWSGEGQPVWMRGPAVSVFEGELREIHEAIT